MCGEANWTYKSPKNGGKEKRLEGQSRQEVIVIRISRLLVKMGVYRKI